MGAFSKTCILQRTLLDLFVKHLVVRIPFAISPCDPDYQKASLLGNGYTWGGKLQD
jgi:hypothetical protein